MGPGPFRIFRVGRDGHQTPYPQMPQRTKIPQKLLNLFRGNARFLRLLANIHLDQDIKAPAESRRLFVQ